MLVVVLLIVMTSILSGTKELIVGRLFLRVLLGMVFIQMVLRQLLVLLRYGILTIDYLSLFMEIRLALIK